MEFRKYQHIVRFGFDEVEDIEVGMCHVFYKVDGTNASVWLDDDGNLCAGSRNRKLSLEKDNAGFYKHVLSNEKIKNYLEKHPDHRLYGEWLVPHTLKTYREDAWRTFYIFDVCKDIDNDTVEYIPYEIYKEFLDEFELEYIPPLAIVKNGNYEGFTKLLDKSGQFLVQDGAGIGEGIVIKNYDYYNRFGKQNWAKIISNEFKEKHHKAMGAPEIYTKQIVEEEIVAEFCTTEFIEKEYAKIINEVGFFNNKMISRLLETVYYELIKEEMWHILKKFKNPKINFKLLKTFVIRKIKEVKKEIF